MSLKSASLVSVTQFIFIAKALTSFIFAMLLINGNLKTAQAQYFAWPPGERDKGLMNCAPEDCIAYVSVAGTGKYDPNANPTEAWIGQPEIQTSIEKLVAATEKFAKKNSSNSPAGKLLFELGPAEFFKQPMAFFISSVSADEDVDGNSGAFLIRLDDLEERAGEVLQAALAEADLKPATKKVKGETCYIVQQNDDTPTISFGIVDNYLIVTFGRLLLDDVVASLETAPPAWMKELDQRIKIDRPAVTTYVNFQTLKPLLEKLTDTDRQDFEKADAVFHFTEFETLQFQNGMNSNGYNQIGYLNHAQPESGLLSALATEVFSAEELSAIPEDISVAAAIKLAPEKIIDLIKQSSKSESGEIGSDYVKFLTMCKDATGFDFEKDYIASIDGGVWVYAAPSLTSPKFVAAAKINDNEKFSEILKVSAEKMKQLSDLSGQQFEEQEKGGNTFYSVTTTQGQTFSFGLVEDHIYLSNSVRGITSHLRKKKRTTGKLVAAQWMKRFLKEGESAGYRGLIGISTYDLAGAFELGLPAAQLMFGQYSNPDVFDFTFDDLPNVGVLVNGLRPNRSAYFRTDTGLAIHSVHDFPIGIEASSGIMVAMLLPAVQQVRSAARRMQSQNNMSQLGLALMNYESNNGHFPPAYSVDAEGNRLLSWRVHILPYLEQQELYDQFRLDEPWDSPHNMLLADKMPTVFSHPGLAVEKNRTVYVAPLNENSTLTDGPSGDDGEGKKVEDITDGLDSTILIIEANEARSVVWTAPQDLRVSDLDDVEMAEAIYGYLNRFTFIYCDGSAHSLDVEEFDVLDRDKVRGSFKTSDGVYFELVP